MPFLSVDKSHEVQFILDKSSFSDMPQPCQEIISASTFLKIISDQQKTIMSLQEDIALLTATNHSQQELLRDLLTKVYFSKELQFLTI